MSALLETTRRPIARLWVQEAPFEIKDTVKRRGFRWSGTRRCWYLDCDEEQLEIERAFLEQQVFGRAMPDLPVDRITARDRYSVRTNPEAPAV